MERQVVENGDLGDGDAARKTENWRSTLQAAAKGEARSGGMEGNRSQAARTESKKPGAGGRDEERRLSKRDNLRRALGHVITQTREPPGIDWYGAQWPCPHLKRALARDPGKPA